MAEVTVNRKKATNTELTKRQIARQDFVDEQVFNLINDLLPTSKQIEWDIEVIGNVREAVRQEIIGKHIMSEKRFYPFVKI